MATYRTIESTSEGLYKDKGSRFISFAIPVADIEEIKAILSQYRKEYFDARHVCYAYMLGANRQEYRQNDDGEPSGTAGKPILGQINSYNLTNILIIVVRYFGGILLGTSGLINAYRQAAADALNNSKIVERQEVELRKISFPYEQMNIIMKQLKSHNAKLVSQEYDNQNCIITYEISCDAAPITIPM